MRKSAIIATLAATTVGLAWALFGRQCPCGQPDATPSLAGPSASDSGARPVLRRVAAHDPGAEQPSASPPAPVSQAPERRKQVAGPQSLEEVEGWREEQRLLMQTSLATGLGASLRQQGISAEAWQSAIEQAFSARDALELAQD